MAEVPGFDLAERKVVGRRVQRDRRCIEGLKSRMLVMKGLRLVMERGGRVRFISVLASAEIGFHVVERELTFRS